MLKPTDIIHFISFIFSKRSFLKKRPLITSLYLFLAATSVNTQCYGQTPSGPDTSQNKPPTVTPPALQDAPKHNTDEPTLLLFTAINEGNVPYVRDAINRGADLEGHNILGQTPLDMAIDLNRNPITFLLLSLRSNKNRTLVATPAAPQEKPTAPTENMNVSEKAQLLQNLPLMPVEYDTAGTTQNPSHGFLGFDGS